jgi:predicted ATPase
MSETNWCVITGGPSSGKTTTVNILRERGYVTTIEHARHYIDTQRVTGKTVEEIRANQLLFQRRILNMQVDEEKALDPRTRVFLDRALPDILAYYRFLGLKPDDDCLSLVRPHVYRAVFVLDLLPLAPDYARIEDRTEQTEIHRLLTRVYSELGYQPLAVPALPPDQRVDFILATLEEPRHEAQPRPEPVQRSPVAIGQSVFSSPWRSLIG